MNTTPKIIIKDNYGIDETGNLTSITIPATVDTIQGPEEYTTYSPTVSWYPITTNIKRVNLYNTSVYNTTYLSGSRVKEVYLYDATSITRYGGNGLFRGCTSLTTFYAPKVTNITNIYSAGINEGNSLFYNTSIVTLDLPELVIIDNSNNAFAGGLLCWNGTLTTINFPKLKTIVNNNCTNNQGGMFSEVNALTRVYLPSLETIIATGNSGYGTNAPFNVCRAITSVNLPKLKNTVADNSNGIFVGCTAITEVRLGSKGNAVTALASTTFRTCTQSNLTITIRVTDPDIPLANQPWGATNATIYYIGIDEDEDAEDRIFNPQNYT